MGMTRRDYDDNDDSVTTIDFNFYLRKKYSHFTLILIIGTYA